MKGVGSVAQVMLEVRVLTSEPPSRVRLLLLIKYKEGVVNKSYFDWTLGLAVRIRPRKGSSTGQSTVQIGLLLFTLLLKEIKI